MWSLLQGVVLLAQCYKISNIIIISAIAAIGMYLASMQDNIMRYNIEGAYLLMVICFIGYVVTKNKLFICVKLLVDFALYMSLSIVDNWACIMVLPIVIDIMQLSLFRLA